MRPVAAPRRRARRATDAGAKSDEVTRSVGKAVGTISPSGPSFEASAAARFSWLSRPCRAFEAVSGPVRPIPPSLVMKGSPVRVRASPSLNQAVWCRKEAPFPGPRFVRGQVLAGQLASFAVLPDAPIGYRLLVSQMRSSAPEFLSLT
jgi:hypothetical protein